MTLKPIRLFLLYGVSALCFVGFVTGVRSGQTAVPAPADREQLTGVRLLNNREVLARTWQYPHPTGALL